ncbi:MAG: hypothetical protein AAGA77_22770, partial [Bacteroidota bacterium]
SRINLNFDPKDVDLVLNNSTFISKYYSHINIPGLQALFITPEACHAALWCLENVFLLNGKGQRDLFVTRYEDFIGKSVRFQNGGLKILNEPRKPSVTSSRIKAYTLSGSEIQNINEVLHIFGVKDRFIK